MLIDQYIVLLKNSNLQYSDLVDSSQNALNFLFLSVIINTRRLWSASRAFRTSNILFTLNF